MIYPFIHIASVSLSGPAESTRMGFHLYPKDIDLYSWKQVVSSAENLVGLWQFGLSDGGRHLVDACRHVHDRLSVVAQNFASPFLLHDDYCVHHVFRRRPHSQLFAYERTALDGQQMGVYHSGISTDFLHARIAQLFHVDPARSRGIGQNRWSERHSRFDVDCIAVVEARIGDAGVMDGRRALERLVRCGLVHFRSIQTSVAVFLKGNRYS